MAAGVKLFAKHLDRLRRQPQPQADRHGGMAAQDQQRHFGLPGGQMNAQTAPGRTGQQGSRILGRTGGAGKIGPVPFGKGRHHRGQTLAYGDLGHRKHPPG